MASAWGDRGRPRAGPLNSLCPRAQFQPCEKLRRSIRSRAAPAPPLAGLEQRRKPLAIGRIGGRKPSSALALALETRFSSAKKLAAIGDSLRRRRTAPRAAAQRRAASAA